MYRRPSKPPVDGPQAKRPLLILMGCAIVMVAVMIALAAMEKGRPDYRTGSCQNGSEIPRAHTVIVIDQTDPLSEDELFAVKNIIRREYRLLKEQDRLTLRGLQPVIGASAAQPGAPLYFTTCRVPLGDEVSILDNNPAIVERQFEQLVGKDLAAFINGLRTVPTTDWSAIVETLENLSDDPMFSSPTIARRLVLISDMIQNTPHNTQYHSKARKAQTTTQAPQFQRATLVGVDVRVHYIFRHGLEEIQNPAHEAYWTRYFAAAGARSLQIGWGVPRSGSDEIARIVWNAAPVSPAPSETARAATSAKGPVSVTVPPPLPDVPPAPAGTLVPGKILVHGTPHAAAGSRPGFINFEIDWRRLEPNDYLVFDARRVLLLTSHQEGRECYVSVPLVTRIAPDSRGGPLVAGRVTRRLESYSNSEQTFVQRLGSTVGTTFEPTVCEIIGARIVNRSDTGPRYRALRCRGPDFSDIREQDWLRLTHATAPGVAASRLAVVSGRHQLPQADVDRIAQSLREQSGCPAQPLASLDEKLLHGLRWMEGQTASTVAMPAAPPADPLASDLY